MKTLVLYDSSFGNTAAIANKIAAQLGNDVRVMKVSEFSKGDLRDVRLLIVGSPINAWRPTLKTKDILESFLPDVLKGVKTAAFDTRIKSFISGNAAKRIQRALEKAGGETVLPGEGFYVEGSKGPLKEGETERAGKWADEIIRRLAVTSVP